MNWRLFQVFLAGSMLLACAACEGRVIPWGGSSGDDASQDTSAEGSSPPANVDIGKALYPPRKAPGAGASASGGVDPLVIPDCHLAVIYKEEVPSQEDGVLKVIGTDVKPGEVVPPDRLREVKIGDQVRLFRVLKEDDSVVEGQLLALLDDSLARQDLEVRSAKIAAAKADKVAAEKTRDEAHWRYLTADDLRRHGRAISDEELRGAKLLEEKSHYEFISKTEAVTTAQAEAKSSATVLQMHEIRSSISGKIKTIYKSIGESVKKLEPVFLIRQVDPIRVEGWVDNQYASQLRKGMKVRIQPSLLQAPVQTLIGHLQDITAVAVRKDGQWIVSASEDGTIRVWDRSTGLERNILTVGNGAVMRGVACTGPDSQRDLCIAGGTDGVARIWDLATRSEKPVAELRDGHKGAITCVAFSPDGLTCATGGDDHQICLWDTATGKLRYKFPLGHRSAVTMVQFTPLAQLVSAGRDFTLRVWALGEHGARLDQTFVRRSGDVGQPGASPDGTEVLFDQGKELRVLSLPKGLTTGVLANHSGASNFSFFAQFSPDSQLILTAGAADGHLQLWRAPHGSSRRGRELRQFVPSDKSATPTCAAFAPDGNFLVTGGKDRQIHVWPVPPSKEIEKELVATLTLVEQAVESAGGQMRVWAELPNPDGSLLPGGTVTMSIIPVN
jgi:WD40 repeat protein